MAPIPTMSLAIMLATAAAAAAALSRRGASAVREDLPPRVRCRVVSQARDRGV